MAKDYASPQPIDRTGNQTQPEQASAVPALTTATSGALLSSIVALDGRATVIEVVTTGAGAAGIKWWGSVLGNNPNPSMLVTNPDNVIPGNWIRRFVIPQSVIGIGGIGSIVGGYGNQNGLYTQLTVMPLLPSSPTSIIITQYQ